MSAGSTGRSRPEVERLRELPSVEQLASRLEGVPKPLAIIAARLAVREARRRIETGGTVPGDFEEFARGFAREAARPRLRAVLNATGVIVHTNLGRAPLAAE